MSRDLCAVALLGCGTVGGGTASLLHTSAAAINQKTGNNIKLKYIVDLDFSHAKSLGLSENLFEKDLDKVLSDSEVKIVVELVGGTTIARDFVKKALSAKKHVVTANKALLAKHSKELFSLARENGVSIAFEASCAGGIPFVRNLYDGLNANDITALYGIVNGTCNYILSEMMEKGISYTDALSGAQKEGLAEADPTLDVNGMDSAHKLTLLSSLAFSESLALESIPVSGIDTLDLYDVRIGEELGYVIKLIAWARKTSKGISLAVRPSFIHEKHPLAWVSGAFNAISVYGNALGHSMYYGRGAGASPTASAVVSDIISVASGTYPLLFQDMQIWPDLTPQAKLSALDENVCRFYIRMIVEDEPGVLAKLANHFADNQIGLSSVLQKDPDLDKSGFGDGVPVVITTHQALEGNVRKALASIDDMDCVLSQSVLIPIISEQEEFI